MGDKQSDKVKHNNIKTRRCGVCVCVLLHSCSCEVKFVQERGVARWEVARFNFLLSHN